MIHSIFTGIASLFLAIGSLFGGHAAYGAVTPVGSTQFTLAGAGVNSTQNTIPLASFTTPDGRPLVMSMFGTIGYGALEPQTTAKLEDITFTGITQNTNGSATLTGVSRGNDFVTPYAASTSLAHSHAGGATFILTNTAGFYTQFASVNNAQTILGLWTFSSTSLPQLDGGATASGNQFVTAAQLNSTAFQGAATATESTLGLTRLATSAQVGVGTASSTSGAPLVIPNKFATTTPGALCTSGSWNCIVATVNGAISATGTFFNGLLAASNTYTGKNTYTATTSIAGSNVISNAFVLNGVNTQWPSAHGTAGSILSDNGAGVLSWASGIQKYTSTTTGQINAGAGVFSTTSLIYVPAGVLGSSSQINFWGGFQIPTSGSCTIELSDPTGKIVLQAGLGGGNNTNIRGTFSGTISATSTASGQRGILTMIAANGGSCNACALGGGATADLEDTFLNWSAGFNLLLSMQNSGSGTCSIQSYLANVIP